MATSYERYTKTIASYLRRMLVASSSDEAAFFAAGLEKFIERNQNVVTREQQLRAFEGFQMNPMEPEAFRATLELKSGRQTTPDGPCQG